MKADSLSPHRRSIRLPGYDYAQPGAYFVTIVAMGRECLFGYVENGEVKLNCFGLIVSEEWRRTPEIRREVELDAFVVMPNHVHGIVVITSDAQRASDVGATGRSPLRPHGPNAKSLGALIAGFKASVTKRINVQRDTAHLPVWQRNYYEHVIRDERDWDRIRRYIESNPCAWADDDENPLH